MRTVSIKIEVTVIRLTSDGYREKEEVVFEKTVELQPGNMSKARAICTRQFNKHLKAHADTTTIIGGRFWGQLQYSPYTTYSGTLTGQRGRIVRRGGTYDV